MTTPAQPDTGAGAEPDTGSAPEDTTADTGQQVDATATDAPDPAAEVSKWKAQARKHEERAKANKKQLDDLLAKQQGEPTLEDLQAQTASERERAEAAEERAAELAYDIAVNRAAAKVGADAEALSDSDRFRREVTEELGDGFDDDDLKAAVQKIAAKFAKDPRFAGGKAPARSGADITGGPGTPRQVTEDELSRMSPEQIVEAQDKGLLKSLLGG